MNLKIIDCTFRDGGYYNNWDFEKPLIHSYIESICHSNIEVIELGFRNFPKDEFLGAFAYSADSYINNLNICDSVKVAVMVNATEIINSNLSIVDSINYLFQPKKISRVDIVRIALHLKDLKYIFDIVSILDRLGYEVIINLMQLSLYSDEQIKESIEIIKSWGMIKVLYFADSLGSMNTLDVLRLVSLIKCSWTHEIGFHAHNNKGLALSNSLSAIDNGVTWVDSTILGMGRGAGNTQTENLLLEVNNNYKKNYKPDALYLIVLDDFTKLKRRYEWGENLMYRLSATYDIHPSYIQQMLNQDRYSAIEIIKAVKLLSTVDSSNFDPDLLIHAKGDITFKGSWNTEKWCDKKEILIIGTGKSCKRYESDIINYIIEHKPCVISLNYHFQDNIDNYVDLYAFANQAKILSDHEAIYKINKPVVISKKMLDHLGGDSDSIKDLWDYGLSIKSNSLQIKKDGCTLPYELSAGYAISFAISGGARTINLVGFDGFENNDIRQLKMNELFSFFKNTSNINIKSLTPSKYSITQGSIFSE